MLQKKNSELCVSETDLKGEEVLECGWTGTSNKQ